MKVDINAKSYSVNPPKPEMGFPEGYLDIHKIGSERLILPEDKVLGFLSENS
jgi:virulence-associated protein VagC